MLGVVLAGGQSTRYGSDKSMVCYQGQTLLDGAIETLKGWCSEVVVSGHHHPEIRQIDDWPHPRMGPLAGIAAALHYAKQKGMELVFSCGVDSIDLPEDLPQMLSPAPAYLASQPVIGLWPVSSAAAIEHILTAGSRHSMKAFAEAIAARAVRAEHNPANINTPEDLARLEKRHGF